MRGFSTFAKKAKEGSRDLRQPDPIIEGSRKRAKLDVDANNSLAHSPASSSSKLPEGTAAEGGSEVATELGFKMLDVLINRIDEDDQPLTIPFLALPSKADYPDYYELIKNPISLEQVRRRLQSRSYESFEQVRNALETVCRNAKRYNQKGSDIYEKSRTMHQIILHAYIDLVEKGDVQPLGDIVLRSDPPLQQQSARLAKLEKPSKRARLDYDELPGAQIAGKVSLRLKKDDDIDYEEDDEVEGTGDRDSTAELAKEESRRSTSEQQAPPIVQTPDQRRAKEERSTPQVARSMDPDETDDGNMSSSFAMYDGDVEMVDGKPLDRSMLTLAGKFDRRKRPGPRGKRLKSTLRTLVGELMAAVNQQGQLITRWFRSLPSRLQYPDYYKVIQRPIALDSIEDKVHKKEYANPYALVVDLRQMVDNAQYYNEEGSEIWEAAEEVRQYVEGTTIPTLLADGFTLDPADMRQSALPVEIAANSTVPAQAAAYRIQMERKKALENGGSPFPVDSVSPELPSRGLGVPHDNKLKVRLNARGNLSASPASPIAEMQPPPPSVALGLSVNDAYQQGRSAYGHSIPGSAPYNALSSLPTSMTPYMNSSLPPSSSQVGAQSWAMPGMNGVAVSGPSLGAHSITPQSMGGMPGSPNMMLPPAVNQSASLLPFQRPTAVQMQGGPRDATDGATNGVAGTAQNLSKRLTGEAPVFDIFRTNVLRIDDETTIVRESLISYFEVSVKGKDSCKASLEYKLRNDITRIHSVSILSHPPELLQIHLQMKPRAAAAAAAVKEQASADDPVEKPWTVSIHHNGKGVRPQWDQAKTNEGLADSNGVAASTPALSSAGGPAPTTSSRVQVPPGTPCRFSFSPTPGANVISVHIHPPTPISALQDIVKEDKHPLRSKAKALLDLPERYRILVYCRS